MPGVEGRRGLEQQVELLDGAADSLFGYEIQRTGGAEPGQSVADVGEGRRHTVEVAGEDCEQFPVVLPATHRQVSGADGGDGALGPTTTISFGWNAVGWSTSPSW